MSASAKQRRGRTSGSLPRWPAPWWTLIVGKKLDPVCQPRVYWDLEGDFDALFFRRTIDRDLGRQISFSFAALDGNNFTSLLHAQSSRRKSLWCVAAPPECQNQPTKCLAKYKTA
jgi:hypothetical protein